MNSKTSDQLPVYPVLMFAAKYRSLIPIHVAVLTLLIGVWASYRTHLIDFAVVGLIGAGVAYFVVSGLLELIELVTELLIPQ